jgi:hypothetical protein
VFVVVVVSSCRSRKEAVSSVKSAPWEGVVPCWRQEPGTSRRANKRALAAVVDLSGRSGEEKRRGGGAVGDGLGGGV